MTALVCAVSVFSIVHLATTLAEFFSGDADYFMRFRLGAIRHQFNLEAEYNLTTWYASATLLFCALLLYSIGRSRRLARDAHAGHWTFLAVVFVLASIDETAMLHEALTIPLHNVLGTSGIFYYAWVVIALPVVLGVALLSLRFFRSLPARTRIDFAVAGGVFLAGGLGLEMVEGVIATQQGEAGLLMLLARLLEEVLEMLGVLLFINALLRFSAEEQPGTRNASNRS